jgi:hypothetical protein
LCIRAVIRFHQRLRQLDAFSGQYFDNTGQQRPRRVERLVGGDARRGHQRRSSRLNGSPHGPHDAPPAVSRPKSLNRSVCALCVEVRHAARALVRLKMHKHQLQRRRHVGRPDPIDAQGLAIRWIHFLPGDIAGRQ